jgi:hypothetical protein
LKIQNHIFSPFFFATMGQQLAKAQCSFSLGNDTLICGIPGSYTIKVPAGFDSYLWSTTETTKNIIEATS